MTFLRTNNELLLYSAFTRKTSDAHETFINLLGHFLVDAVS